jgi:hypothetical protein
MALTGILLLAGLGCRKIDNQVKNFKPFIGKWEIAEIVFTDYADTNSRTTRNAGVLEIKPDPEKGEWNPVFFPESTITLFSWFEEMVDAVEQSSIPGQSYCYAYSDYDRLRFFFWGVSRSGTITRVVNVSTINDNNLELYYPKTDAQGNLISTCRAILRRQ